MAGGEWSGVANCRGGKATEKRKHTLRCGFGVASEDGPASRSALMLLLLLSLAVVRVLVAVGVARGGGGGEGGGLRDGLVTMVPCPLTAYTMVSVCAVRMVKGDKRWTGWGCAVLGGTGREIPCSPWWWIAEEV